jgi:beta-glucosidase
VAHPTLARLSLEEKAGLLSGASFWRTRAVEHAGVEAAVLTDGPHGVRLQRGAGDHLGLNDSEPATSFPTAAATGSSWDPDLLREMGAALGREARALGVDVLLGPGVNLKRSPLCGRNFEYFAEDPLLAGVLGAAWVEGVQAQGVGASVKHFAANNQETDRMRVSVEVDERTLRETYLPAFERVVTQARPATVMCSYNRVNGTYASQHPWLLTDVLRGDWGFDGYVVSDWGAVVDPVAAVTAGLDLEMPGTGERSPAALVAAVRSGALDEAVLDAAVERVLVVHERLRAGRPPEAGPVDHDAHHELARRVAVDSMVLLANVGGLLPLDPATGGTIAVVGELATTPRYQGAGSSKIAPTRLDTALRALRERTDREVLFQPGYSLEPDPRDDVDEDLHEDAVTIAERADVVLLFLGLPPQDESEGFDRTHLALPPTQLRLAERILGANPRTVVVLANGSVVTLDGAVGRAPALLETWLAGQAGGSAVADVLLGRDEPGGRLAETIPLALEHTPAHLNWPGSDGVVRYGERMYVGYRHYDAVDREVARPFGFGLGYTTFGWDDLVVEVDDPTVARARVELSLTNTGSRAGSEVVQVYVEDVEASVDRPVRELRAFSKVHLEPGEQRTVVLELDERAFAFWSPTGWRVEPGVFRVRVGPSSRDLPLHADLTLEVPAPVDRLDESSTLDEWFHHPTGGPVLRAALGGVPGADGMLADGGTRALVGPIPLRTLLGMTGGDTDPDAAVAALLAQVG